MNLQPTAAKDLSQPADRLTGKGSRGRTRSNPGKFEILERHDSTWSQMLNQPAQDCYFVSQVDQDETPDNRVKFAIQRDCIDIPCNKRDVGQPGMLYSLACQSRHVWIEFDSYHAPLLTDVLSQQERHIPCPTPYIQHPHPRRNASHLKKPPGQAVDKLRLALQPLDLFIRIGKQIAGIRLCVLTHTLSSSWITIKTTGPFVRLSPNAHMEE